ncbi:MAG: sulfatase [Bryobacteraceae bacterium]
MNRREFLQTSGAAAAAPGAQRPNVLFIMADQLRFDCLGANGNGIVKTPNIDRLAEQSVNLTNAFVQAPVCVPSRISFFTGRYPHSHKNRVNYTPCDAREIMIQRRLRQAGYRTASVGKLHFTPPTADHARDTGFDQVQLDDGHGRLDQYSDYAKWRKLHDPKADVPYDATVKNRKDGGNPHRAVIDYEFTQTAWVGEKSCEILRTLAAGRAPFFLFSSFFKPHAPRTVPAPFDSLYDGVEIPMAPPVSLAYIQSLPKPVQAQILRGKPRYNMDRTLLQWDYRSYYGLITAVDRQVGRILDELEKSGQANNTIVVFTSDHGDQMLAHGLEGKNVFFEESVHVPLLVRYPERLQPGKRTELIEAMDVCPTLLDLCGLPVPEECQGRSFAQITGGPGGYRPREFVFSENIIPEVITGGALNMPFEPGKGVGGIPHPDAKMIRTKKWKLNYYPSGAGELYDLENDPQEYRNLYADGRESVIRELKGLLLDLLITADENDQIARKWVI